VAPGRSRAHAGAGLAKAGIRAPLSGYMACAMTSRLRKEGQDLVNLESLDP